MKSLSGYTILQMTAVFSDSTIYTVGYYVAVINQWMCEDCYNDFIKSVDRYEEDMRIENRNFDRFCNLFNVEIEEKV